MHAPLPQATIGSVPAAWMLDDLVDEGKAWRRNSRADVGDMCGRGVPSCSRAMVRAVNTVEWRE